MKKELLLVATVVALMALGIAELAKQPPLPDVHVSNQTGQCVRVIEYTTGEPVEVACPAKLPKRYRHVWVQ